MILPDVNVLVYAFRPDARDHSRYRRWLNSVTNGNSLYGMSAQVLASVVRIASNPKVCQPPTPAASVIAFANTLLAPSNCRPLSPGPRHWEIYSDLVKSSRAQGNLTQDAWFAAIAIEYGCEWITADSDFGRFRGLRWSLL